MSVTITSRFAFDETVSHLLATVAAGGGTVFATIDQAAAARQAGLELRPTTLILFGNPKAGTPLMAAFTDAALDLPLKLLVSEDDGRVSVSFIPASETLRAHGLAGFDAALAGMDGSLRALAQSVAAPA